MRCIVYLLVTYVMCCRLFDNVTLRGGSRNSGWETTISATNHIGHRCTISATHNVDIGHKLTKINNTDESEMPATAWPLLIIHVSDDVHSDIC